MWIEKTDPEFSGMKSPFATTRCPIPSSTLHTAFTHFSFFNGAIDRKNLFTDGFICFIHIKKFSYFAASFTYHTHLLAHKTPYQRMRWWKKGKIFILCGGSAAKIAKGVRWICVYELLVNGIFRITTWTFVLKRHTPKGPPNCTRVCTDVVYCVHGSRWMLFFHFRWPNEQKATDIKETRWTEKKERKKTVWCTSHQKKRFPFFSEQQSRRSFSSSVVQWNAPDTIIIVHIAAPEPSSIRFSWLSVGHRSKTLLLVISVKWYARGDFSTSYKAIKAKKNS